MRLKKAEKEKYLRMIRDSKNEKIVSLQDNRELEMAWFKLVWDHYQRLLLDLKHIARLPLLDMMNKDVITDGDPVTLDYLKRYSEGELETLQLQLNQAKLSIQYLQNLIIKVKNDDQAKQKQSTRNGR